MSKGKTPLKVIAVILTYAIVAAGGYYIGTKTIGNVTSAIPKEEMSMPPKESPAHPPAENDPNSVTYVTRSDISAANTGTWSEVSRYSGDVTGDSQEDTITLYTSAERADGEILWDDGQNWIVEVADGSGGYYTLVNQYVNNGSVYIEVSENNNREKIISVISTGASGLSVKRYSFSSSGFVEETVCKDDLSNVLYSSIPYYK